MSTPSIAELEHRVAEIDAALAEVRRDLVAARAAGPPPAPVAPPVFLPPPPRVAPQPGIRLSRRHSPRRGGWDDLLAGQVMAWVGGSALVIAVVLFLALAVSRGWIGEEERTALAGLVSLLLLAGGAVAYERRGRTEAALSAAAAGVAGCFATIAVATEVYGLIPPAVGLADAMAIGATAAALALRWKSRTMAILGLGGALLSPVLAGADPSEAQTIAVLGIAYAGAIATAMALNWKPLAVLSFLLSLPQWAFYVLDSGPEPLLIVAAFTTLTAFTRGDLLLALNATTAAALGAYAADPHTEIWLAALAAVHVAAGLARRDTLTLAIAVILADVALADTISGLPLALAWTASAAGFAVLMRAGFDDEFATLGLGGHIALAIGHVWTQEGPPTDLGGDGGLAGLVAATAIVACCLISAHLIEQRREELAQALNLLGLLALAYLTALAADGPWLVLAYAAQAAALATIAPMAAIAFLLGAIATALLGPASIDILWRGFDDPAHGAIALGAIAAASAVIWRPGAALALLYLASGLAVSAFDGQEGQLALSALWAAAGVATLIAGLVKDHAAARTGALALLGLTVAKVYVVDLAALDQMTRVGSFLALGTLLLAGAFAWQRIRPHVNSQ